MGRKNEVHDHLLDTLNLDQIKPSKIVPKKASCTRPTKNLILSMGNKRTRSEVTSDTNVITVLKLKSALFSHPA